MSFQTISFSGLSPYFLAIIVMLICSLFFALIVRKNRKLVIIPLSIFVVISVYFGILIHIMISSLKPGLDFSSEEGLRNLFESSTSPGIL
jgi:FtsH-binding integral membrane protein